MTSTSYTHDPTRTPEFGTIDVTGGTGEVSSVNLPNFLTLCRLLVVPVFAVLLLMGGTSDWDRLLLWSLFAAACVTDVFDGRLARSRGQVTRFGVMMDPIADKALVGSALVGLSVLGELPWWATGVVLGREALVTLMRIVVLKHGLIPASRGGKFKAITQNVAVAAYLLPLPEALEGARIPLLVAAVVCTVVTGLDYARAGMRVRREGQRSSETLPAPELAARS